MEKSNYTPVREAVYGLIGRVQEIKISKKITVFIGSYAENAYVCNESHTIFRGGRSSLFLRAFFIALTDKIFGFRPPCGALMRPQLPRKVCDSTGKRKPFLFSAQTNHLIES